MRYGTKYQYRNMVSLLEQYVKFSQFIKYTLEG